MAACDLRGAFPSPSFRFAPQRAAKRGLKANGFFRLIKMKNGVAR
jgi:hypothetical protein